MAYTLANLITEIGSRLWDPLNKRYTQADIIRWLNFTLDDVATQCRLQKKQATVNGSGYVTAAGTAPRYFALPSDFLGLVGDRSLMVNGSIREPMSAKDSEGVAQETDYFYQDYSGIVFNYAIDREVTYLSTAPSTYTTGGLMWFYPEVEDSDVITYWYTALPTQFSASDTTATSNIARNVSEVLVHGAVYRAMQKAFFAGAVSRDKLEVSSQLYERALTAVEDFYLDEKRSQGKPRIRTAQHFGMYNSAKLARRPSWQND